MSTTSRTIQYLSSGALWARLENVELRVVADNDEGILPLIEAESQVVSRFAQEAQWPHQTVTFFILTDLSALQRQLQALGRSPVGAESDQVSDLLTHPVVNVYDLAAPAACHVFVNRQAMEAAGYWKDMQAMQGLLAHEHAHPLAECATTYAVRQLQLNARLQLAQSWTTNIQKAKAWADRAQNQMNSLLRTLLLLGPREVFTNEIALATGFSEPLLHLNRQNVTNLIKGLAYRPTLQAQLADAVRAGHLSVVGANALSLIGDLQGHLMLAMEVAAFQRQKEQAASEELLDQLHEEVFPALHPVVEKLFTKLCESYVRLPKTASAQEMARFVQSQLVTIATLLAQQSLRLTYQVTLAQ